VVVPIKTFETASRPKELNWMGMQNAIKIRIPIKKPNIKPIRYDDLKEDHQSTDTKT
jgi:hypothetical protein